MPSFQVLPNDEKAGILNAYESRLGEASCWDMAEAYAVILLGFEIDRDMGKLQRKRLVDYAAKQFIPYMARCLESVGADPKERSRMADICIKLAWDKGREARETFGMLARTDPGFDKPAKDGIPGIYPFPMHFATVKRATPTGEPSKPLPMPWAGHIRAMREALALSGADFAALMGVTERAVRMWEKGERSPSVENADRMRALELGLMVEGRMKGENTSLFVFVKSLDSGRREALGRLLASVEAQQRVYAVPVGAA